MPRWTRLLRQQPAGNALQSFADMLELGGHSAAEHARVGMKAAALGIDYVLTYGTRAADISRAAAGCETVHYDQKNILAEYLAELVAPGDVVLIKGSRGMAMEEIIAFLQQRLGTQRHRQRNREQRPRAIDECCTSSLNGSIA